MRFDRRNFMKTLALGAAGYFTFPSYLFLQGCKKEEGVVPDVGEGFSIDVDNPPYKSLRFLSDKAVSGPSGDLIFNSDNYYYDSFFAGKHVPSPTGPIEGIEAYRLVDKRDRTSLVFAHDPSRNYLPKIIYRGNERDIDSSEFFKFFNEALGHDGNTFVDRLDAGLPYWDWERVYDRPGMVYLGDWTINEFSNFTDAVLKIASTVLTFLGTGDPEAYSIMNKVGDTKDLIIDGIDLLNKIPGINIDKDKKHAIFSPDPFFFSSFTFAGKGIADKLGSRIEDIRDFFPLLPGSNWDYSLNGRIVSSKVDGRLEDIAGDKVTRFVRTGGGVEYIGFFQRGLRYFGFEDPDIGRVILDPPVLMGDDELRVGKAFTRDCNIVVEKYPQIKGNLRGTFDYKSREIVIAGGVPFGGAFKVKESVDVNMRNEDNGQSFSNSDSMYHWYSKNVGQVKMDHNGSEAKLVKYNLGEDPNKKRGERRFSEEEGKTLSLLEKKIVSGIKSLL
ncbi:hypothetical protein B6U91_02165 [Candidatus Pacearchaeota archaeon ex4484_71]|nr:MAG: hypothetical protein B6U91_02165 [Candidatus Pacearchaeota archaeon ex4484_71]